MTLEDETGIANAIVWPKVFEQWRREVLSARLVVVEGMLQKEQEVIHVIARRFEDLSAELFDALAETAPAAPVGDRKSGVSGKSVPVRVALGGRGLIKKKKK